MGAVAENAFSVILSSHLIADLERVCDYLIVLAGSRVQVAGPIDGLRASHHRLTRPHHGRVALPAGQEPITVSHTDVQSTLLVRHDGPILDPAWSVSDVSLEDLVLAYIGRDMRGASTARTLGVAS
jgi:ABC-2 type transport system ATP-binding protein